MISIPYLVLERVPLDLIDKMSNVWKRAHITESGCWEFNPRGEPYPRIVRYGVRIGIARILLDVPDERCVKHKCENPHCFRPSHLSAKEITALPWYNLVEDK